MKSIVEKKIRELKDLKKLLHPRDRNHKRQLKKHGKPSPIYLK